MGRKNSTKGKEKRMARKEEQVRIAQSKEIVDRANKLKDPMEPFAAFRKFNKNGIEAQLYVKRVTDLDEDTKEWIFQLERSNMKELYDASSFNGGWKDEFKREELMDEAAWYLIAEIPDGKPIGFSHFRFDLDEGIEVLYCYELQIEPEFTRKGLGKFMMQILELMAFTNSMRKVILTILKMNNASNFFKALNYQVDESSPIEYGEQSLPYEILSKINKKLVDHAGYASIGHHHQHHCCPGHH